jgi:hypothetical protein
VSSLDEFSDDPFFIFYRSRSGSTYLASALMQVASIVIPPEANFVADIVRKYRKAAVSNDKECRALVSLLRRDEKFSDWQVDPDVVLDECRERYPLTKRDFILMVCSIYRARTDPDAKVFGFKKGSYTPLYESLFSIFPNAKSIGLIRDGRAVYNSQKSSRHSRTRKPMESSPRRAADAWCERIALLRRMEAEGRSIRIIHYEDLLRERQSCIESLCGYLGVSCEGDGKEGKNSYAVPERYDGLHDNVKGEPLLERIDAWKQELPAGELRAFESVARKTLIQEGYVPVSAEKR